jgi:hypothetical protein
MNKGLAQGLMVHFLSFDRGQGDLLYHPLSTVHYLGFTTSLVVNDETKNLNQTRFAKVKIL